MSTGHDATSSSPTSAAAPAARPATSLAPGFRFHPTDEELVSYYLKRKVLARPFRVDAISEIDLYKAVPWDLPRMSRIQSRDTEWYFFSPLDKKYANRSRTNRATGSGYWKTTGKDRAVRRGAKVVGMKKTLVYHVGRAPKGERTNWVMHEYRLEDDDLARAGVPQDEYVVCRIFQKSGAGPQNGAQYGAPFIEEEWDNDEDMLLLTMGGVEEQLSVPAGSKQIAQVDDDFEEEIKDVPLLNENDRQLLVIGEGLVSHNLVSASEQNAINRQLIPKEVHENQESIGTVDQNIVNDGQEVGMDQYYGLQEQHQSQGSPAADDYLELKDLIDSSLFDHSSMHERSGQSLGVRNDQMSNRSSPTTNLPELYGVEEFFKSISENADLQRTTEPLPFDNNGANFELNEMMDHTACDYYLSGNQADDGSIYYDVPSHHIADDHGSYVEMNDFLGQMIPGSSTSDPVEELIAYFDATDDYMHAPCLENPDKADSSSIGQTDAEVDGDDALQQTVTTSGEKGAALSFPAISGETTTRNNDHSIQRGVPQSRKDWSKTITGRLVGMLGAIPAPQALAAELPTKGGAKSLEVSTSARSSSSIHITASMIHIDGVTIKENGKHWSVQKTQDVDYLLSYGMERNTDKMHGGVMSFVRSGFSLPVLSILFLAISFKMAICIYSR